MAVVRISPVWDAAGRHEYLIVGTVGDALNELRKLAEDVSKVVKALEELVEEVGGRGWVNR
jgi:phage-related minor tail protein